MLERKCKGLLKQLQGSCNAAFTYGLQKQKAFQAAQIRDAQNGFTPATEIQQLRLVWGIAFT